MQVAGADSPHALGVLPTPPAPFAALRRFPRCALIVRAESPARSVYVVGSGYVRVYFLAETGEETSLALLGPGQVFGIAALLGFPTCRVFAEALTAIELWELPVERLRRALPEDTAVLGLLVGALGRRLAAAEALLRDVALLPVSARVSGLLGRLSASLGGEPPRLTNEYLARSSARARR